MTLHSTTSNDGTQGSKGEEQTLWLPNWVVPGLWVILCVLMTSLLLLAALVLVRSGFFTSKRLTDEQTKSLWAFLGAAMAAAATLLGALLTEQNNRRTSALTREVSEREHLARQKQQALAQEAEERLLTDTVARVLELITVESGYAPRARVAGAIATLMQLRGGTIAIRILGELWKDGAVDSDTAVWLINRVLSRYSPGSETEANDAATLLFTNSSKLIPSSDDTNQVWNLWPSVMDPWPSQLPYKAKEALLITSVKVLLTRELSYWVDNGDYFPIKSLCGAMEDGGCGYAAGQVLCKVLNSGAGGAMYSVIGEDNSTRARALATRFVATPWFESLLDQIDSWAAGDGFDASNIGDVVPAIPSAVAHSPSVPSLDESPHEE